jgi:hypothetical protein
VVFREKPRIMLGIDRRKKQSLIAFGKRFPMCIKTISFVARAGTLSLMTCAVCDEEANENESMSADA